MSPDDRSRDDFTSRQERVRESGAGAGAPVASSALLDLVAESADELAAAGGVRSRRRLIARRFLRHKIAVAALVVLLLIAFLAVFASTISPYDFDPPLTNETLSQAREGPSWDHLFGTDKLGRDQFIRVLHATQKSLQVGIGVALISALIGIVVGAVAGFYGRLTDQLLMRFTDLWFVVPDLAVLLILAKNPDPSFFGLFDLPPATEVSGMILVIAVLGWMPMARIVRGEVLRLRERDYVEAARAAGASGPRIILRHLLPNAVGPIVVFATLEVGLAILTEATLSFLGAGIELPDVSLGNLIADAEGTVGTDLSYLIIFPGLVLFLIALCVNFVGDGLRDALDPRTVR